MNSIEILRRLVAFETVSRTPNIELIDFVANLLREAGIEPTIDHAEHGSNANLYATIGPDSAGGVMLSGHTDVVPITGQDWHYPPFTLTEANGRLYGRGTADMKGFVACAIRAMCSAAKQRLKIPLHLALSYDEEVGCVGVRSLLHKLEDLPHKPRYAIIGEPTNLGVAIGHKGKCALHVEFVGRSVHSALAPTGTNAIYLASEFIEAVKALQAELKQTGRRDHAYDIPYSTVHVGILNGGTALNIVPASATIDFEIRHVAEDAPQALIERLHEAAQNIVTRSRNNGSEADVHFEVVNQYPGLDTPEDADIVDFLTSLTGANTTHKVAFGTEAGLFSGDLGIESVVCGPGSMDQGHKPDEFVTVEQMNRCDALLESLTHALRTGL